MKLNLIMKLTPQSINFYWRGINSCVSNISNNHSLPTVLVDHLLKAKKESKNSKKQEIQNISTEMN